MHIKRNLIPKTWPVPRKSNKKRYVAVPTHAKSKGITILYVLRDVLKIVKTRKEAKLLMMHKDVKINHKIIRDENYPLRVSEILTLDKMKKNYRLEIVNQKFHLREVSDKETEKKIVKIVGKKIVKDKAVQMNLGDGGNFLTKDSFSVGDSAVVAIKENKVEKILALKEGSLVDIVAGKHAGKSGKVVGIKKLTRGNDYLIKLEDKEVMLPLKTLLVVG